LPTGTPTERTVLRIAGIQSKDETHRGKALESLADGWYIPTEEATPELANAIIVFLKDSNPTHRSHAIHALERISSSTEYDYSVSPPKKIYPQGEHGELASKIAPLMGKMMNDGEERVRTAALYACRSLPTQLGVKELIAQLQSLVAVVVPDDTRRVIQITGDQMMIRNIISYLGDYGPAAKEALPLLNKIQKEYPRLASIASSQLRKAIPAIEGNADR
jgi:hypothetical protein